MKKMCLLLACCLMVFAAQAQNYNNILNYNYNGTPTNGVKIKTNIPYISGSEMPTITINGYNYQTGETIGLTLVYYIYANAFCNYQITSFGTHNPPVSLSNENGLVVIYLAEREYFQRFTVSAYAQGMSEQSSWFQGWTTADEALSGSNTVLVPYATRLAGNVTMPGNGIWNSSGNVGIGTQNPGSFALAVNGTMHAKQINVDVTGWSDFVFKPTYKMLSLPDLNKFIKANNHLPDVPTEAEVMRDGVDVAQMNKVLLQKVEELTLYLIEKDKDIKTQQMANQGLKDKLSMQQKEMDAIKRQLDALPKFINKK